VINEFEAGKNTFKIIILLKAIIFSIQVWNDVTETTIITYFKTSTIRRPNTTESPFVTSTERPILLIDLLGPDHNPETELERNIIILEWAEINKKIIIQFSFS
jgi:hypothetical protein